MGFLALTQRLAKREAGPVHLPFLYVYKSVYFPKPPACLIEALEDEQSHGVERHWEGLVSALLCTIAQSPRQWPPELLLFCLGEG